MVLSLLMADFLAPSSGIIEGFPDARIGQANLLEALVDGLVVVDERLNSSEQGLEIDEFGRLIPIDLAQSRPTPATLTSSTREVSFHNSSNQTRRSSRCGRRRRSGELDVFWAAARPRPGW